MNEHTPDADPVSGLHPEDGAALEALINAGYDVRSAIRSVPNGRERLEHLAALLKSLDSRATSDRSLADVTFARVMQARGQKLGSPVREPALSPDDDAALESLVMSGFDSSRVPGTLRERARKHEGLARLVTSSGRGADASLRERTLARVQAHVDTEAGSLRIETRREGRGGRGFRIADLVSVAALLLIGTGVAMPVLSAARESSRRSLCKANLGSTAQAMATYAGSNRDALPMATASLGGDTWWKVGTPTSSNSANLYTLARSGYVPLETLACPGNPKAARIAPADASDWKCLDEISYSYQLMFGPQRPAWRRGSAVLLADHSPVIGPAQRHEQVDPFANALNHKGAGQHVLCNDGTVCWETSPVLKNGDNIWLTRALEQVVSQLKGDRQRQSPPLNGTEMPDVDDTFLVP